jgi:alanine dehydrogenase
MDVKILRKSEYQHLSHFIKGVDLLINAISWPAEERAKKKYLVTQEMLEQMNPHGVVLDLSVDFPNPIQTSRPTTLSNPWYREHGKVHIGIYGYPGLVPVSCTRRYSEQILPIIRVIASHGSLDKIDSTGDVGRYIARATVNPEKLNWRSLLKPTEDEPEKSYIE